MAAPASRVSTHFGFKTRASPERLDPPPALRGPTSTCARPAQSTIPPVQDLHGPEPDGRWGAGTDGRTERAVAGRAIRARALCQARSVTSPSDHQLVAAANRGEAEAFAVLYRRHRDFTLAVARQHARDEQEALDVLHDAFSELLSRFPGFELTGTVRGYLYRVVVRRCISLARKRNRVLPLGQLEPTAPPTHSSGDFERLAARLSPVQREVVLLRFVLDMKIREIAVVLDVPEGTVKSRLHGALRALRDEI